MEKNGLTVISGDDTKHLRSVESKISQEDLEKAENELRARSKALFQQIETTYWELGQALYDVYDGVPGGYRDLLKGEGARNARVSLFQKWGYSSFEEYCEKEIGILRRSASNLRYAYYWFEIHLTLPREIKDKIKALGRSKVYLLSGFVNNDDVISWLNKAQELTHDELKKAVKAAKAINGINNVDSEENDSLSDRLSAKTDGARDESGNAIAPAPELTHTLTTSLYEGQWGTWQAAFDRAKNITNSDKISHNLEMICTDFLSNNGFADPKDDLKRYIAKFEQLTGKKIIAIDPQSGSPVYGGDLLWMLVREKTPTAVPEAAKESPESDISLALAKKRAKKKEQDAVKIESVTDQKESVVSVRPSGDDDGPPSF